MSPQRRERDCLPRRSWRSGMRRARLEERLWAGPGDQEDRDSARTCTPRGRTALRHVRGDPPKNQTRPKASRGPRGPGPHRPSTNSTRSVLCRLERQIELLRLSSQVASQRVYVPTTTVERSFARTPSPGASRVAKPMPLLPPDQRRNSGHVCSRLHILEDPAGRPGTGSHPEAVGSRPRDPTRRRGAGRLEA
jgi:hypothetical protein